jgi:hypothetical protein
MHRSGIPLLAYSHWGEERVWPLWRQLKLQDAQIIEGGLASQGGLAQVDAAAVCHLGSTTTSIFFRPLGRGETNNILRALV